MADQQPQVIRNADTSRFEVAAAPETGYIDYRQQGSELTLVHTQVGEELEGQGVGSALVRAALDHAEAENLTVVPECAFVAGWLDRHPERAEKLDIAAP